MGRRLSFQIENSKQMDQSFRHFDSESVPIRRHPKTQTAPVLTKEVTSYIIKRLLSGQSNFDKYVDLWRVKMVRSTYIR